MQDKITKCIYCNAEQDLTDSDIIPYALTGAKLHRRFVCKKHNEFTNDNYEKNWINSLSVFRNLLGFTTREGVSVTFNATVKMDDIEIEDNKFSNVAAMLENKKRLYHVKGNNRARFGNIEKISAISKAHDAEIAEVNLSSFIISTSLNSANIFTSYSVLHAIAKIAYESYCYYNEINEFRSGTYNEIVDYILNPNNCSQIVEMVVSKNIYDTFFKYFISGTNSIFEYVDSDGYKYVIFGLWNIIFYKIKICKTKTAAINYQPCKVHLFYPDDKIGKAVIRVKHIESENAVDALNKIYPIISKGLENLYQPYFSYRSLLRQKRKFEENIIKLASGKLSINQFLEIGNFATISYIYMFEFLLKNKKIYNSEIGFLDNLHLIVGNDKIELPNINDLTQRYITMFENDELISMLEKSFNFFDSITE